MRARHVADYVFATVAQKRLGNRGFAWRQFVCENFMDFVVVLFSFALLRRLRLAIVARDLRSHDELSALRVRCVLRCKVDVVFRIKDPFARVFGRNGFEGDSPLGQIVLRDRIEQIVDVSLCSSDLHFTLRIRPTIHALHAFGAIVPFRKCNCKVLHECFICENLATCLHRGWCVATQRFAKQTRILRLNGDAREIFYVFRRALINTFAENFQ